MRIIFTNGYIHIEVIMMMYRVHKYETGNKMDEKALEKFLNNLDGEIVSMFPDIVPKFRMMGATAGYDSLIIVEKLL